MNKPQALYQFWAGFGLNAFDETSVPQNVPLPYLTYESATGALDDVLSLSASLWYRSTGWAEIEAKTQEIAAVLPAVGFYRAEIDGGYLWINRGKPFAQRMDDPNDPGVRRMVINIQAEFLTAD